jgi:hypothetical protein
MSKPLRPDDLWAVIEPLLTPESSKPEGRRPCILEACRSHRFSVYSALRHAFEVAAARDGLRFRPDMLATLAGLAERWSVGEAPARTPRPPRRRNAVDFRRAALDSASIAAKGELCHSRQGGHQAPRPHGRERHSTRSHADRSQRPRQQDAGRGHRYRTADPAVRGTHLANVRQSSTPTRLTIIAAAVAP